MQQPDFSSRIKLFVDLLVAGDYQGAIDQSFHQDRLQATDIAEAIRSYPGHLTAPPRSAYEVLDVYEWPWLNVWFKRYCDGKQALSRIYLSSSS